jgi:3,4-dihydroxy-2-butanone 4-phosphate synthase
MAQRDPISALRAGELVVLVDEDATEGGVELWLAAELAEAANFGHLVRHTCGFVTVALPAARCAALGLPPMAGVDGSYAEIRPVQAVTCDAAEGTTTGISAADRALTARLLTDPDAAPEDFRRPGHLVPLRIRPGLTDVAAPASAALDLCEMAGLRPGMIRCEAVLDGGALAGPADGLGLARTLGAPIVQLGDLVSRDVAPIALTA